MRWKNWKAGAIVSLIFSALVAGAAYKHGMYWTDLIPVFCVACATHFGTYIKDHPTDSISFDTTTITKQQTNENQKPTNP